MIEYGPRTSADKILRTSVGSALVLGGFFLTMILVGEAKHVIPGTTGLANWFVPLSNTLLCPTAFSIALLALGRHRVLRDPVSYWTGVGFVVAGFGLVFWILARPGILPGGQSFIGNTPSTAPRIAVSWFSLFGVCLLASVLARRPRGGDLAGWRWPCSVAVWALLVSAISIAAVAWERSLPRLVDEPGVFTLFYKIWVAAVGLLYAAGAALSLRRYRRTGDTLLGYVTFVQISIAFIQAMLVAGGQRYGYLFLGTRLLLIGSFTTMLIGVLTAYVELFRREQDKAVQLQARSAELLAVLESIPDAVFVTDREGRVVLASAAAMDLAGGGIGRQIEQVRPERALVEGFTDSEGQPIPAEQTPFSRMIRGEVYSAVEVQYHGGTNSPRWLLTSGRQLRDQSGARAGGLLVANDITSRKRFEARITDLNRDLDRHVSQLRSLLQEKTLLLQEVQHRVKNNLQVISSMAFLQAEQVTNIEARGALLSMRDRVKSMALIHEGLCFSDVLTEIDFGQFVRHLAPRLIQSYAAEPETIRLHVGADVKLRLDEATPCALIVNELLSNALKHAFPDSRPGSLAVKMRQTNDDFLLEVRDDGVGLPAGFSVDGTASLGLQVVTDLAAQLRGQFSWANDGGAVFRVQFRRQDTHSSPVASPDRVDPMERLTL